MSDEQKMSVYIHYYCAMLALKYNFVAIDKTKENWSLGWSKPHKETKNLAFYWLWKDVRILSYDEFICPTSQRYKSTCLQGWYEKNKKHFNFTNND